VFQPPEINEFKDFFDSSEFSYGEQLPNVRNKDIARAQQEAYAVFPANIFDEKEITIAFHYLTAHFLWLNNIAKTNGGTPNLLAQSQSADGLSVSYNIPPNLMNSPILSQYLTTAFGSKYALMLYPAMLANSKGIVSGRTTP